MARCLVWRLLLLTGICLTLGLSGCAEMSPDAREIGGLEAAGPPGELRCQGKGSAGSDIVVQSSVFPSEVEGLQLISMLSGEEACNLMNGFFGSGCNIKEAYIAEYSGQNMELVFWITEMPNEQCAANLLEQMNSRTIKSDSFTGHQCIADGDVGKIYYVRVKGNHPIFAHNYYYCRQNKVYWVNLSGDKPLAVLKKFMMRL